jgi:hypothetical protein
MPNFDQITEKLNAFLARQGLEKIAGIPTDLESLFGSVMASIWRGADKQKRETLAFTVAGELKKLFGGKNLEDIYARTKAKLDAAEESSQATADVQAQADRKKDPHYIPSFDELFGKK